MGKIADLMINGKQCSHCGMCFEKEHGCPVLCQDCYENETEEERAGLPIAVNSEL